MGHGSNLVVQGENVRLQLLYPASTTTCVAINILDGNGNLRVLAKYERLIIDSLETDPEDAAPLILSSVGAGTAASVVVNSTNKTKIFAVFGSVAQLPGSPSNSNPRPSGMDLPLGIVPTVCATSPGPTNSVFVNGTGRIVATTQPGRPNWRELLTPGGNF